MASGPSPNLHLPTSGPLTSPSEVPLFPNNSPSKLWPPPSALSVETRISPAKHGIAVSLCLVDTSTSIPAGLAKVDQAGTQPTTIGWVSPTTWDSRNASRSTDSKNLAGDLHKSRSKGVFEPQCLGGAAGKSTTDTRKEKGAGTSTCLATCTGKIQSADIGNINWEVEGEYMILLEFVKEKNVTTNTGEVPVHIQMLPRPLTSPLAPPKHQTQRSTIQLKPHSHSDLLSQSHPIVVPAMVFMPNISKASPSVHKPSALAQKHGPTNRRETNQGVRTVHFSEEPCTPFMKRGQGAMASRAQELSCCYRESYQAALQNPVNFGGERENERESTLAAVEEGGGQLDPIQDDGMEPCCVDLGTFCGSMEHDKNTGLAKIRKYGETNTFPCWKSVATSDVSYDDSPASNVLKPLEVLNGVNVTNAGAGIHIETTKCPWILPTMMSGYTETSDTKSHKSFQTIEDPKWTHININKPRVVLQTVSVPTYPNTNISKSYGVVSSPGVPTTECDKRCPSSLSNTIVETSEKCEVVVHGKTNKKIGSTDPNEELVPRLHVVKCKNTTAFGLVSPKIIRRRIPGKDDTQFGKDDLPIRNRLQTETQAQPPLEKTSQHSSLLPRPDHLPLDSSGLSIPALHFGTICLTGGRDNTGRAVVEVYGDQPGWLSPHVSSLELFHMLLYFHLIIRREVRELGMTVVVDARKNPPASKFYGCLLMLQKESPDAVHGVVMLVDKESSHKAERGFGIQTDFVTSLKALYKIVEVNQLTSYLEGSLPYSHRDWLELHQKLHPFVPDLYKASGLLLVAIRKLDEIQKMDNDVPQCIAAHKTLIRTVLDDSRLVGLQREGGAILARLRRESDLRYPHHKDYSDAVDSVTNLFNHVEEQAHELVKRSNLSLEHLEYLLQLKELEGHFAHIQEWFDEQGERQLLEADSVEDSRDRLEQTLLKFTSFLMEANDRKHQAMSLVSEAEKLYGQGMSYPETEVFITMVCTFKSTLDNFLLRADTRCLELEIMVTVCAFCEQADELARECKRYLDNTLISSQTTQDKGQYINTLQSYQEKFLQFSAERFQELKIQAYTLRGSRGMRVWNIAWLKVQEASQQLQERLRDVDEVHQPHYSGHWCEHVNTHSSCREQLSTPVMRPLQLDGILSDREKDVSIGRPALGSSSSSSNSTITLACCNIKAGENNKDTSATSKGSKTNSDTPAMTGKQATEKQSRKNESNRGKTTRDAASLSQSHTVGCQWFPWQRGRGAMSVSEDAYTTAVAGITSYAEPHSRTQSNCSHNSQPSGRILQVAQKFQISRHGSFCSEESCSQEFAQSSSAKRSSLPVGRCEGTPCPSNPEESSSESLRLQRVMEELVLTEREYVRSLGYIMTHYHPLLQRPDITQDLRGKRAVVFGNLEKLYDFHVHFFLPELEACQRESALLARCFLRHSDQFGLYALYSKNKPRSDALILHKRHDIFKRKQQELGDQMDLSSYLLRPIQRISKYSLLLQDMLRLCASKRQQGRHTPACGELGVCDQGGFCTGPCQQKSSERSEICAAIELVRFQMRHGNDLLTMDAIQDCDVNLKEQGQLIRQDEFTVFFRKKKCVRRVFLFQDLILFSKTKKTDNGDDVYVYKQSFKTCDIGMTHNSSMSDQCFEIWFRRRKSEDTYTLKADRMEVKTAWTTDLEQILWEQAAHSRELCIQERVFMGMGRRVLMDIQPSKSAICDNGSGVPLACFSHSGLENPRPNSIGSGSTASTSCSQTSFSSGRGSLPPVGYPCNHSKGAGSTQCVSSTSEDVSKNYLHNPYNHHHHQNCQHQKSTLPFLINCPELSDEITHVLSISDHTCFSATSGQLEDPLSFASQNFKSPDTPIRAVGLKRNSLFGDAIKKPCIASKPPKPTASQSKDVVAIGKSTEV